MSSESPAASAARFSLPVSVPVAIKTAFAATGFGIFVVWAWHDGGFAPEEWLPGGLLLLALLCTASASAEVRARLSARPLPLVLFGLYVAWSYLSILWAQVPADALDGANRTLVYWLVFALFTGLGLSERLGSAVVLAWGVALAALGLVVLIQTTTDPTSAVHFDQGRLSAPISYPDGDAALFLSACLALVVLASRRQTKVHWRLVACAGAVVLADLSVLCQSRGALVWFPCALVLYLAVARNKLRALAHVVLVAAAVAPAVPALLHVYSIVVTGHDSGRAAQSALAWIAGTVGLAVIGLGALFLFERHITLSGRARVLIGTSVAVLAGRRRRLVGRRRSRPPSPRPRRARLARLHDEQGGRPHKEPALHVGIRHQPLRRLADRDAAIPCPSAHGSRRRQLHRRLSPRAGGHMRRRVTRRASSYVRSPRPGSSGQRSFSASSRLRSCGQGALRDDRARRDSHSPASSAPATGSSTPRPTGSGSYPRSPGAGLALLAIAAAPTAAEPSPARKIGVTRLKVAAAAGAAVIAAAALAIPWAAVSLIDAAVARGPSP